MVFISKRRRKILYGTLRRHLGEVFHRLAGQKESRIEEGHLMPDHVHMLIAIPPKYAVSQVIGYIKGKSAIHVARVYVERQRNFKPPAWPGHTFCGQFQIVDTLEMVEPAIAIDFTADHPQINRTLLIRGMSLQLPCSRQRQADHR